MPLPSLLLLVLTVVACTPPQKQAIEQTISNTTTHFAPDGRVALFDVNVTAGNDGWILQGETNLPEAKEALLDSLSGLTVPFVDSINVLPAPGLDGKTYGIVNNSVANLRSRPSHPAQLVTQALLGMPLKVLKKHSGWYFVQTPDDYLGWIDDGGFQLMTGAEYEEWKSSPKIIYLNTYGYAYERPSEDSPKVSDLAGGNILKLTGTEGSFYQVSYPDGRAGFVHRSEARSFKDWKASVEASGQRLVETAMSMKGAPYLWGGTSAKGMDCSGFTKTIYFINGRIIPRDASQQVHAGKLIDTSAGFENLRPGDLLFFGTPATDSASQRVVHVGMWIGDHQFIHSSGRVRISSVDSTAENYDRFNLNRYLEARRYLNNWRGNIIKTANMYEQIN